MHGSEIEHMEPENFTPEHAQSLGKQVGTLIAASVFKMGLAGNISETLSAMNKASPGIKKEFQEHVWLLLGQALDDGVAGAVKRNDLAHALRDIENNLRREAWSFAVTKAEKGSGDAVTMLEDLVRTADQCGKAAKALYSPLQRNLDSLITDGRRVMALNEMSAKAQAQKEDAMHDDECDDPDCDGHLNH